MVCIATGSVMHRCGVIQELHKLVNSTGMLTSLCNSSEIKKQFEACTGALIHVHTVHILTNVLQTL